MKKRIVVWIGAAAIAFAVMCLGGCVFFMQNDVPPASLTSGPDSVIPGGGGEITASNTAEYEFTPDRSGIWLFRMTVTNDSFSNLEIINSEGGFVANKDGRLGDYHSFIAEHLDAGRTYTINAVKQTYAAGTPGDYTLSVSLAEEIPGGGGEVYVDEITVYTFTPDRSGEWTFRTYDNGDCDPSLVVYEPDGGLSVYDNDGAGDRNALLTERLEEGTMYLVNVYMKLYEQGSYTLSVEFSG